MAGVDLQKVLTRDEWNLLMHKVVAARKAISNCIAAKQLGSCSYETLRHTADLALDDAVSFFNYLVDSDVGVKTSSEKFIQSILKED